MSGVRENGTRVTSPNPATNRGQVTTGPFMEGTHHMLSMPDQPAPDHKEIDKLLAAVDHQLGCLTKQRQAAKRERRRLRRSRLVLRGRAATLITRTVLRVGLMLGGTVSFIIGLVFLVAGKDGGKNLLEAAAAAWGLAAAIPPRK